MGAEHLSGPDGLLEQLRQRGYRIKSIRVPSEG
ncbi:MAG: hypothetical protein JO110_02650 [Acetobacteraceae bacterium]|nr:hypothetical protein [Acetobacteraceae bacterium]